ncbi:DUF6204 family protein [Pseudofrankia sp. DC12]|uniref:DUF6204 family protein n=1 Tax=Pseudofrankia sp. DC12 TaxID=683315 RepID=UPI000A01A2BA
MSSGTGWSPLLARAAQHDLLHAAFTAEGHRSYDLAARSAFTFRFLDSGEAEADILEATQRAEAAAEAWLTARGYGYKNLRSQAAAAPPTAVGRCRRGAARPGGPRAAGAGAAVAGGPRVD